MTGADFNPGNVQASPHVGLLEELLSYAGDRGLAFGSIDDNGAEASVAVTAAPIAKFRLTCWQIPGRATLAELGLEDHPFARVGCWPVDGESPAAARARGSAAESASGAASALRAGDIDAASRLLSEALQHLAAVKPA